MSKSKAVLRLILLFVSSLNPKNPEKNFKTANTYDSFVEVFEKSKIIY